MKTRPAIRAVASYLGSKRYLADKIVEQIGPHTAYWGLCCGSAAVELAKPPCAHETLVDRHGDMTNLLAVLASPRWEELHERACRTAMSDAILADAIRRLKEPPQWRCPVEVWQADIDRAYYYLIASWMGRNGYAGTKKPNTGIAVRYGPEGGHGGQRWRSVTDSLPWWANRFRGVVVLQKCLFEVLPKIHDKPGVSIYIDPPYIREGGQYLHAFTMAQHEQLAAELSRFKHTRVVVSYYADDLLSALYPDWNIIDCTRNKQLAQQAGKSRTESPEVLLVNGPVFVAPESEAA